jgi:Uroporphyrinogen decarboxylase (URO-D)
MNSRTRFLETMRFGQPDRVPYFQEGLREEVLQTWVSQGLGSPSDLASMFPIDGREEVEIDGYPHPGFILWPNSITGLGGLRRRLKPKESRLPEGWRTKGTIWRTREGVLMLEVHHGFFLTMGVNDWKRFYQVMQALTDRPDYVLGVMYIEAEMVAILLERFLSEVQIDAAIFSEPIGGNNGSLISPRMYEKFVLSTYLPILNVLNHHGVEFIILRTYANARVLIPSMLKFGINCLWACETNAEAMDYRSIRGEFGRDLRLIGGIDLDMLREGKEAIRREIEEKVPPLLEQGGYVPLADGRVRADIPFENYLFYRRLLEEVTSR